MQEMLTMAKTKIDDLSKGTEEMDAKEQKAAKGGATIAAKPTLAATQAATLAAQTVATPIQQTAVSSTAARLTPPKEKLHR
jgi:hypothetical protein